MFRRATITASVLILTGAMLGGCLGSNATAPATYDLVAPKVMTVTAPRPAKFQLVVNEPTAVRSLDTNRIMVKSGARIAYYKDAAWSDHLPRLMQARMVEAFQNAGLVSAVGSRADRMDADLELTTQVQAFEIAVDGASAQAHANFYVKVINGNNGRMVASRGFESKVASSPNDAEAMVNSLNQAFDNVLRQVVPWVAKRKL